MTSDHPAREPDCLFCGIAAGDVPADVVAQDEHVLAFRDLAPQAPVHVLVISRDHHVDVGSLAAADPDALVALVLMGAQVAADEAGAQFRLVFNSGRAAGQSVDHVHGHVLGGRPLTWPPG